MDNILLLAFHPTSLRTMISLGQYIKEQEASNPVLISLQSDQITHQEIEAAGLEYVAPSALSFHNSISKPEKYTFRRWLFVAAKSGLGLNRIPLLMQWQRHLNYSRSLSEDLVVAERVLDRYQPDALLLPDDRSLKGLPYIRAAQKRRMTTVVVPVSFSNQIGVSIRRVTKVEHRASGDAAPLWNRYIAWRYPQQMHEFRGRLLLFYPGSVVKALADHGMLPPNPWVVGGGNSDYLAVDGYDAKDQAVRHGVPKEKVYVTGHISHDLLYQRFINRVKLRAQIIDEYGFDPSKKLIICAVPHVAEHNMITWEKHWEDVEGLVQALMGTGQNVLLSLHPKSDPQRYAYLEEKYSCRLARENLDNILVVGWLFVAGYSSTIRWAVLCGIPSIVVDFNQFGYDIYDHWDGVLKVNSLQMLAKSLDQIFQDGTFYTELQEKQKRASRALTDFDGNARKRIYNLIEQAITQPGQ